MSVKQFARVLVPGGDDAAMAKMMRQVRHWTALDLLRTAGPKATGTGVSRVYDENELYKAVILEELVRLGVPTAFMEDSGCGEWLENNKKQKHWQTAKTGKKDIFLHLASNAEEGSMLTLSDDPARLVSFLAYAEQDEIGKSKTNVQFFSSLIIVNVTALFRKVP